MRERKVTPEVLEFVERDMMLPHWQVMFIGRMRELMDKTGKTNKQIANDLNNLMTNKYYSERSFSEASLSNYITVKKKPTMPSAEALVALADYFEVTTDYLVGKSDAKISSNEPIHRAIGLNNAAIEKLRALKELDEQITGDIYKDYSLLLYENDFTIIRDTARNEEYAVKGKPSAYDLQEELQRAPDGYFHALSHLICDDDLLEIITAYLTDYHEPMGQNEILTDDRARVEQRLHLDKNSNVRTVLPKPKDYEDALAARVITDKLTALKQKLKDKDYVAQTEAMDRNHIRNYPITLSEEEKKRVQSLKLTYRKDGLKQEKYRPVFKDHALDEEVITEMQKLEQEVNDINGEENL